MSRMSTNWREAMVSECAGVRSSPHVVWLAEVTCRTSGLKAGRALGPQDMIVGSSGGPRHQGLDIHRTSQLHAARQWSLECIGETRRLARRH